MQSILHFATITESRELDSGDVLYDFWEWDLLIKFALVQY